MRGFIFLAVILFLVSFVSSECVFSEVNYSSNEYCSVDGWEPLKENGELCVDSYECLKQSCFEGVCGDKYASVGESLSFLEKIYLFLGSSFDDEDDNNGGNNNGGGSSERISVVIVSPLNFTYSSGKIDLKVYDSRKNARFWKYSLNDGDEISFVPNTTLSLGKGSYKLEVRGSKSSSSSGDLKTVFFSVDDLRESYCGDGICNTLGGEGCDSCSKDCGSCSVVLNEPDEIKEVIARGKIIFWILFSVLVILILGVSYAIFYVYRKNYSNNTNYSNYSNNLSPIRKS